MSGFKLIAITPLASCDRKFSKNLKIGKPYQFYSNYKIKLTKNLSKIESVEPIGDSSVNIYKLENDIKLDFSAVVGKNGTGKSSIFELLYYTVYAICTEKKINGINVLETEYSDLERQLKEVQEYYHWLKTSFNIKKKLDDKEKLDEFETKFFHDDFKDPFLIALEMQKKYNIEHNLKKITDPISFVKNILTEIQGTVIRVLLANIRDEKKWEIFFRSNFACSILYEQNGSIKEMSYQNSRFSFAHFNPKRDDKIDSLENFDFANFIYTISVDSSFYSTKSGQPNDLKVERDRIKM